MSQDNERLILQAALRRLREFGDNKPVESDDDIIEDCDTVAYYMLCAHHDIIENWDEIIDDIRNENVLIKIRERVTARIIRAHSGLGLGLGLGLGYDESSEDESSEDTDDTIVYAIEGGEETKQLDNPPLRV
tara:strand:+ start:70 stop:465 length:396 start_codon:yes stop_codon:yes gene_type:complete